MKMVLVLTAQNTLSNKTQQRVELTNVMNQDKLSQWMGRV